MANNPRSQSGLCKNCHSKPVYIENGRAHDFCGKRCAGAFNNNVRRSGSTHLRGSSPAVQNRCIFPGCHKQAYVDEDGNVTDYCSHRHRREVVQLGAMDICLHCKDKPTVEVSGKQSDFCSRKCSTAALGRAPTMLEVPSWSEKYHDVANQFTEKWKHPTQVPTVIKIWKIYEDRSVLDQFSRYQLEVERRTGIPSGNTRRRFHGTIRKCSLGDTSLDGALCPDSSCNMCRIIETSFQLAHVGQHTHFGRFGAGIYTSAASSKSNDYYDGSASPSLNRAMLINDVVIGRAAKFFTTMQNLTEPPAGFDSVIGEPGGDLNYDECIDVNLHAGMRPTDRDIEKNDAIRPSFLIVYK
ncbi:hypothetical protein BJV74DRAFT_954173 [Russula compacta]|nr:hypothetical protein BJV74DRAFT_954173 [Russula compacta]